MKNDNSLRVLGHKFQPHHTSGDFDMAVFDTPAGAQGPPPHIHKIYKEAFLILEGEMEFMINGEIQVLKAGESLDVPPGTLHTFNNKSNNSCRWVSIHSPKGFFDFFEMIGISDDEENATMRSVDPDIIQKVLQNAEKFDMSIPPPPKA